MIRRTGGHSSISFYSHHVHVQLSGETKRQQCYEVTKATSLNYLGRHRWGGRTLLVQSQENVRSEPISTRHSVLDLNKGLKRNLFLERTN